MISSRRAILAFALSAAGCGAIAPDDAKPVGSATPNPTPSAEPPPPQSSAPTPPAPPPPSHCTSNTQDSDETDVDCGGSCAKCGDEQKCAVDGDCRGGHCASGVCRSAVVDIAAGGKHTCALYGGGSVRCWGDSDRGQLGLGIRTRRGDTPATIPSALPRVNLGKKRFAVAISAGPGATCAILEGGSLVCWGANVGATGPGTNLDRGIYPEQMGDAMPAVALGTGRTVRSIASGMDHWCAVLDDASVKCWGNDFNSALGNGGYIDSAKMGDARPPVRLGTGRTAKSVGSGGDHGCALLDDATLKCWGGNGAGQLGVGNVGWLGSQPTHMGDFLPRVQLGTGRTVKQIALGFAHTCAILDDDTLKCWGSNAQGQLGLGDLLSRGRDLSQMGDALPAIDLGPGRKAKLVAVSGLSSHTCVLLDDQTVRCVGWNELGQLGQGDTVDRGGTPADVPGLLPPIAFDGVVTKLTVGGRHACVMLAGGAVKCWGDNTWGQLGLGDTDARGDAPSEMGASLPAVALTVP